MNFRWVSYVFAQHCRRGQKRRNSDRKTDSAAKKRRDESKTNKPEDRKTTKNNSSDQDYGPSTSEPDVSNVLPMAHVSSVDA